MSALSELASTTSSYSSSNSLGGNGVLDTTSGQTGSSALQTGGGDQLKSVTIKSINYDYNNVDYKSVTTVTGTAFSLQNTTDAAQTFSFSSSIAYIATQYLGFDVSSSEASIISSQGQISIPGIDSPTSVGPSDATTTISGGQSTTPSQSNTKISSGTLTVPAYSTYIVTLTGSEIDAVVPFSFTGTANYTSGAQASVSGTGNFSGVDTGAFSDVVTCVSSPGGCSKSLSSPSPVPEPLVPSSVPEPSAALLLSTVLMTTVLVRALRSRKGRNAKRPMSLYFTY